MTVLLTAPEDTKRFGRILGALLQSGDTLALVGDLGAGKTTLTQAIARGMGITAPVTSPTFTLVHEYPGPLPLFHFDTYRFDSPDDIADIGFDEYFERGGVVIIEWADRIAPLLPAERLTLCLSRCEDTPRNRHEENRILTISASGARHQMLLEQLKNAPELNSMIVEEKSG
jgi:tRNA threonylcarbamoyladenosine biosynthesis protein TsaE